MKVKDPIRKQFCIAIKRLRQHAGLSAAKFAIKLGIPPDRYSKWEQGKATPKYDDVSRIEDFFEMPLDKICELTTIKRFLKKPAIVTGEGKLRYPNRLSPTEGIFYVPATAHQAYVQYHHSFNFLTDLDIVRMPSQQNHHARYRLFELKGHAMSPTLEDGALLFTERIDKKNWKKINNYYTYLLVLEDEIVVARLVRNNEDNYIAYFDNDSIHPQTMIYRKNIQELWLAIREINEKRLPPKKFVPVV